VEVNEKQVGLFDLKETQTFLPARHNFDVVTLGLGDFLYEASGCRVIFGIKKLRAGSAFLAHQGLPINYAVVTPEGDYCWCPGWLQRQRLFPTANFVLTPKA
jgi:hypothetical protein